VVNIHFHKVVHSLLEVLLLESYADGKDVIGINRICSNPALLESASLLVDGVAPIRIGRKGKSLDGEDAQEGGSERVLHD
jgi:hypothetical protein